MTDATTSHSEKTTVQRLLLTGLAALLFALGWVAAIVCASGVWVGTAVKVGWSDGWKAAARGPAR